MPPVHAPSALDDPIRLAAVAAAGLLDSEREDAFDDLTRLAATLMGAPFALATVVDSSTLAAAVVAAALEHRGGEASDDTAAVVLRMPVA